MKHISSLVVTFFALPLLSLAQTDSIQSFGTKFVLFLRDTIVPFLFSVALLIFIYNVIRYFIIEIDNVQAKETAKRYAIYSISAFVIMVSIWGIVNLFVDGTGLGQVDAPCPDYIIGGC